MPTFSPCNESKVKVITLNNIIILQFHALILLCWRKGTLMSKCWDFDLIISCHFWAKAGAETLWLSGIESWPGDTADLLLLKTSSNLQKRVLAPGADLSPVIVCFATRWGGDIRPCCIPATEWYSVPSLEIPTRAARLATAFGSHVLTAQAYRMIRRGSSKITLLGSKLRIRWAKPRLMLSVDFTFLGQF